MFVSRLEAELGKLSWFEQEKEKWQFSFEAKVKGVTVTRTPPQNSESATSAELFGWIAERSAPSQVFIIIDELAVFLHGITSTGEDTSEFLHSLRLARESNPNIHMVFAGSIGLHHVVPAGSGSLNELRPVLIESISDCDAMYLALCLAEGKDLQLQESVAWDIARAADVVPYYVQYIVQQMSAVGTTPAVGDAERVLNDAFNDPLDPLDAEHYRERLKPYYGDDAALAEAVLDELAVSAPLSIDQLTNQLNFRSEHQVVRSKVIALVSLLEKDHYLRRIGNLSTFSNKVLARLWAIIQRLN